MAVPTPLKRVSDFEKLGLGMFAHWGLYSQLGMGEWTYHLHGRKMEDYKKLADTFTAEDFAHFCITFSEEIAILFSHKI